MPHSTPIPTPESIEVTQEETYAFAARVWEIHAKAASLILHDLVGELHRQGYYHGRSLLDIAGDYGWCPKVLLRAAWYLSERGVISFSVEDDGAPDTCRCEACQCQRSFLSLPFDLGADERLLRQGKYVDAIEEAESAQRLAVESIEQQGYVYLLRSAERYKIGITTDVGRRLKQLRSQQPPFPIDLVHSVACGRHSEAERALHDRFSDSRVHGEWFSLTDELVENVVRSMNEWRDDAGASIETDSQP